jgi:endonuclease YncB( thermonuclease family)
MFSISLIDLSNVSYETTEKFVPPISYGKVVKVYDGDTITIATPLNNTRSPIYHFPVRLRGIDTPEIHGKTKEEKAAAVNARNALSAKILGKMVFLQNIDMEKYGRILADVFLEEEEKEKEDQSLSEWMIENHYAVAYDGGKKSEWNQETLENNGKPDDFYKITTW